MEQMAEDPAQEEGGSSMSASQEPSATSRKPPEGHLATIWQETSLMIALPRLPPTMTRATSPGASSRSRAALASLCVL